MPEIKAYLYLAQLQCYKQNDFLLYTKKETSRVLFTITYGCYHESMSVLFLPLNQTTSCQYKLSKIRGTIGLVVLESK